VTKLLNIGRGLKLDPDYIGGGTFALLGKKGAGKSFTTRVLAEEFWDHQVPFALIDPMGANWGLRSSADGKGEGIPVPIFGGEHGDAPLERTAGAVMADLLIDGLSMILDLSGLGSRAAERQFGLDFFERLYRGNSTLVHVLLDEADLFAPQKPAAGDQPLLGVTENIVRRGRNRGIAITLISQRPAVINKDVLTQVDGLWLLRITSPQDREAARTWMEAAGEPDEVRVVTSSLATLKNGEAWVWIPELGVFQRVQVRMARTFDSSPTRKRGDRIALPKGYADVDLDAISEKIAGSIERAKAADPKELRRQISALKRELADRPTEKQVETVTETVEVPVLGDEAIDRLADVVEDLAGVAGKIVAASNEITSALGKLKARPVAPPVQRPAPPPRASTPVRTPQRSEPAVVGDFQVVPAQQRILDALAMLEQIGLPTADKTQLALFAGTKPTSGGYKNNLGALRNQGGLIEYPGPGLVQLTDAGRAVADAGAAPSSTDELHALVRGLVPPAQWSIVDTLIASYPDALTREELADRVGAPVTSGGFKNNLGRLRSLGLIDYPTSGMVEALPVLFLKAAA
jgi:hypothetical protein